LASASTLDDALFTSFAFSGGHGDAMYVSAAGTLYGPFDGGDTLSFGDGVASFSVTGTVPGGSPLSTYGLPL